MYLFVWLAVAFVVLFIISFKKSYAFKMFAVVGVGSVLVVYTLFMTAFTLSQAKEMPEIKRTTKTYLVKNGISDDQEFAFFYTTDKCVIFERNKDSNTYRKIYYEWSNSKFNLDKDLVLVYNKIERMPVENGFFTFRYQSIEEFCGLTQ